MKFHLFANCAPEPKCYRNILVVLRFYPEKGYRNRDGSGAGLQNMFDHPVVKVAAVKPKDGYTSCNIVEAENSDYVLDDQVIAWAELPSRDDVEFVL